MDETTRSQCISYGLYRLVSIILGPWRVIETRRSIINLWNYVCLQLGPLLKNQHTYEHLSGSYAEGFRFKSSDRDYMIIYRQIKVVSGSSHLLYNYDYGNTILLLETAHTRPGFALLRFPYVSFHNVVTRSCVMYSQDIYVSSSLWKEATPKFLLDSLQHGPCESGTTGEVEFDFAHCLKCDTWPELADMCVARLLRAGWPSVEVIRKILKDGCHLVAIGGRDSQTENIEWRISFSFAEKTLIHNMNHCQFLCYGLLKILLKEVIENGTQDKLLCSYFLKTAVFWEICENTTISWTSSNYFDCFWACFKRLIFWVVNEYCPNFFIPENNMFHGKVQGHARLELLDRLIGLYNEGVYCLLRCPTLHSALGMTLALPFHVTFLPKEDELLSKSYYDFHLITEILNEVNFLNALQTLKCFLTSWIAHQMRDCDNEIIGTALSIWNRYVLQYLVALSVPNGDRNPNNTNRCISVHRQRVLRALRKLSFDHLHHRLLSAVFMYRHGHYRAAVKSLQISKINLQQANLMYRWNMDIKKYRATGGEHTHIITMMRRMIVTDIQVPLPLCVPELTMEHQVGYIANSAICFPPLAMANFLLYLCYHHLREPAEADAALHELTVLVRYDDGDHIPRVFRAISWTMLGICQEMSGDLPSAYQSYTEALNDQFNLFKDATKKRIHHIAQRLHAS